MNNIVGEFFPLVSVGVPTYNRPQLLERALLNLTKQTWTNIEIIISDNGSTDPDVKKVIDAFSSRDFRIRSFFQNENLGPLQNFCFVLEQSNAEYFMWVADDDYLAPWFIERCLEVMISSPAMALCTAETQYLLPDGTPMPAFKQGDAFRKPTKFNRIGRMEYLLKNNFDNLIYGLFRKEALINKDKILWQLTAECSSNEIPPLLLAAMLGEIIVLPDTGIYKTANHSVYAQAHWEESGGWIPKTSRISSFNSLLKTWEYHSSVLKGIKNALNHLGIPKDECKYLISIAQKNIVMHFFSMVLRFKRIHKK